METAYEVLQKLNVGGIYILWNTWIPRQQYIERYMFHRLSVRLLAIAIFEIVPCLRLSR